MSRRVRDKLRHTEAISADKLRDTPLNGADENSGGGGEVSAGAAAPMSSRQKFKQKAGRVKEVAERLNAKEKNSKDVPVYLANEDASSKSSRLHTLYDKVKHRHATPVINESEEAVFFEDTTVLSMERPKLHCLRYTCCSCPNCSQIDSRAFYSSVTFSPIYRSQLYNERQVARKAATVRQAANAGGKDNTAVLANADDTATKDTPQMNGGDKSGTPTTASSASTPPSTEHASGRHMLHRKNMSSSSRREHLKEKMKKKQPPLSRSSTVAVENPTQHLQSAVEGTGLDIGYRFVQRQIWKECTLLRQETRTTGRMPPPLDGPVADVDYSRPHRWTKPKTGNYKSPLYKSIAGCDYDSFYATTTVTSTFNSSRGASYNASVGKRGSKLVTSKKQMDPGSQRGSADWIAEVVLITTSLHTPYKAFYDSRRCQNILDCKGVEYFHVDVVLDHETGFPDASIVRTWRAAELVFADRRRQHSKQNDALVPQLIIDGVPVGGWYDLESLENDHDLDYLLAREACPNCLMPRNKNHYNGNCRHCKVSWRELVSPNYATPQDVQQLIMKNVYNTGRVAAPTSVAKDDALD